MYLVSSGPNWNTRSSNPACARVICFRIKPHNHFRNSGSAFGQWDLEFAVIFGSTAFKTKRLALLLSELSRTGWVCSLNKENNKRIRPSALDEPSTAVTCGKRLSESRSMWSCLRAMGFRSQKQTAWVRSMIGLVDSQWEERLKVFPSNQSASNKTVPWFTMKNNNRYTKSRESKTIGPAVMWSGRRRNKR